MCGRARRIRSLCPRCSSRWMPLQRWSQPGVRPESASVQLAPRVTARPNPLRPVWSKGIE